MGMVFQHFNLFPHLTVKENLEVTPRLDKGEPAVEVARRSEELLEKVGLSKRALDYPSKLSGGQNEESRSLGHL